jgi:GT2 family glycosyltransferase
MMKNNNNIRFSIIIPVYNRPDEIKELLSSLTRQTYTDFEVIIVEDGSSVSSEKDIPEFKKTLNIKYFKKENSGPGLSRNYGMQRAEGNYFIILDSDVIVPENYMQIIYDELTNKYVDAFGGPDEAAKTFSPVQKAINYAMTSFLTTGGIRGKGNRLEKFHPRSFNMGISKKVFNKTGGFSSIRYGEDIDLSIRIMKEGFATALFKKAFVYHKRRNNYKSFFKQVFHSGQARVNLYKLHPKSLKLLHFFPALFLIGLIIGILTGIILHYWWIIYLYVIYLLLILFAATKKYKDFKPGLLSVWSSIVMLTGYGWGFITGWFKKY